MNRPPGPGSGHDPDADIPWYLRRPASDDHTEIARPRPTAPRPAPRRRYPPPTPAHDVNQPPTAYRPPPRPPVTPWYQRPDRPAPPAPAATPHTPPAPQQRRRLTRQLLIGAGTVAVLIAAAVIVVGVTRLGATGGKVLDVAKVQVGVLHTLSDPAGGYGANTVTDVSCNNGHNPSANKGTTFTCDATVNGAQRHVTVVVSDDNGTYEIDAPR